MAREEITVVICDKCGMQDDTNSTYEPLVTDRMKARGWLITVENDYCPNCYKEDIETDMLSKGERVREL